MASKFFSKSNKTFRPKRNIKQRFQIAKYADCTLGSGNLKQAVKLPEGEDKNEWIACNVVDFYNQINMLYGTVSEFCTEESCPIMNAGQKVEYFWADGNRIKKPKAMPAPKYCDHLFTWIQEQLDDETIFPSKIGEPFPKNFQAVSKTILRRLFRVYAHIYWQHFKEVLQMSEEAHLNTSFKHFIFFVQEFQLIDKKELAPLDPLIEKLNLRDQERYGEGGLSHQSSRGMSFM